MSRLPRLKKLNSCILSAIAVSAITFNPSLLQAQALEEVVVTAQRRVQSLQEVPISIDTFSGIELTKQGFRTMEDMGQFSPSVEMNESLHEQSVTIRGQGNDVAAMSVEQSAPIFVDGVHFGRPSMIKGAFMDVERVEVLTGPQPVYFGQNATAGAFSITTKKPTFDAWEGDATAEFGNFGRVNFEGGAGGPINDEWAIRVAGQWDHTGGHLTDVFTGNTFPNRTDWGSRVTVVWKPTEQFEGTAKVEYLNRRSDGDTNAICLYDSDDLIHDNYSIMFPGEIPEFEGEVIPPPNCEDGFGKIGNQEGTGYFPAPIQGINNDDGRSGILDIRDVARQIMPDGNLKSREPLDSMNFRLSGTYTLANEITIEGIAGLVNYDRDTFEASDESPYLMEAAFRTEQFDMASGEVRVSSPTGGQIEWSTGIYYQAESLNLDPVVTVRANIVQPLREHHPYQDSEWKSVFGTITYNFLDDKASIDVGGRYSDVSKTGGITAKYATWIFDINPDATDMDGAGPDLAGDGRVVTTEHRPAALGGDLVRLDTNTVINCQTGLTLGGNTVRDFLGRPVGLAQCGPYGGRAGFYTHIWRETDVPDAWDTMSPIDIGTRLWGLDLPGDNGPFQDAYDEDSFDPQVTLRYRPTDDHSLYAKWARAFKAGGFDTSDRGISRGGLLYPRATGDYIGFEADGQKEFTYKAEHAEVFEVGAKGNLMDSRLRYGATLFIQTIEDLQLETEIADITQLLTTGQAPTGRYLTNAGKQRNKGLEFDFSFAATDQLTLRAAGVVQDSIMVEFIGGCSDFEAINADTTGCYSFAEARALLGLPAGTGVTGLSTADAAKVNALEGSIDRSGEKAPRAPDWKVILGADYERPMFDRYLATLNTKMAISDGYTEDTLGFTLLKRWPTHADWNVQVAFGDADKNWDVGLYFRNILNARQKVYLEYEGDASQPGLVDDDIPQSAYFNYGLQFNYYYK